MSGDKSRRVEEGVGLALSGGGFRATLYHIGALLRLNQLGWLKKLSEVTSVSGGSITAAYLGYRWHALDFDGAGVAVNFEKIIVEPLRRFCSQGTDVRSILIGILTPGLHPSMLLARRYAKGLFGAATLQDLPSQGKGPRFTIYATNMQTGVSVRLAQPYMADYRLGEVLTPRVSLAAAVAASSAFPPVLCPVTLRMDADQWKKLKGADLFENREMRQTMYLVDGGVYDNLGLERIWDRYSTVLVSDAGAPSDVLRSPLGIRYSQISRTIRTLNIITEQTRALRKRQLIEHLKEKKMAGTYWGIATQIGDYKLEESGLPGPLATDSAVTRSLAEMRTRLNRFEDQEQKRLINWGYALTDAAMRRHVLAAEAKPGQLPYPDSPL